MAKVEIHVEGRKPFDVALGAFTTVGRRRDQRVQLMDELVSKQHAVFFRKGDDVFVRDVGSSNGTFVNDARISADVQLRDQDRILMGNTLAVFKDDVRQPTTESGVRLKSEPHEGTMIFRKMTSEHDAFRPAEAIQSAQQLKKDYEKLRLAFMLSQQLRNVVDRDELFKKILTFLFHHLQADRVAIMGHGELSVGWEVIARRSILGDLRTSTNSNEQPDDFEISSTLLDEVVERNEAVLSYDATMDSRFSGSQSLILQGVKAIICVPIHVNGAVEFLLYLDSLNRGVFTEQDLEVLETFSTYAGMALENIALIQQVKEEAKTRANLERLMSPNLVDKVVSGELEVKKGGVEREVTVLFLDIRNFVGFSENKPPEEIITILNEFFELMVEVIFYHEGTLDKYIGDCIMAFWGAPIDQPEASYKAVLAARQMMDIAEGYARSLQAAGASSFQVGIGINTDRMVAGYVGATRTMSYTVIGKGVNLASRLCGQAKGGEILLAPNTYAQVQDRVDARVVGETHLKGLSQPVWIYRLREIF
jgi:adenylate cyclase